MTLIGLPLFWETFITTMSNSNVLQLFDEIVGKLTHEESRMIERGRIQKHTQGEPIAYIAHEKRKKAKEGPSRKPPSQNSKGRNDILLSHIECYNCHKKGHYAHDCPENRKRPRYNTRSNNNNKRRKRQSKEQP